MKRSPIKVNPEKVREWKNRSRQNAKWKPRSKKRASEESIYNRRRLNFLAVHPICPVTGERTTQIHHSAKREGKWLLLELYWVAVSDAGHKWIEDNKREAEKYDLMVRIRETYEEHIAALPQGFPDSISLTEPRFYKTWDGVPFYLNTP